MSAKPLAVRIGWKAAQIIQALRDDLKRIEETEFDMSAELRKLEEIDALVAELLERVTHG